MILPHCGHTVFSEVRPFSRFTFLREGTRRFFRALGEERKAARRIPPAPNRRFGYSRWRISQLIGGMTGVLLAFPAVHVLVAMAPKELPRADEIRLNGWVLGFTLGLAVLRSLVS